MYTNYTFEGIESHLPHMCLLRYRVKKSRCCWSIYDNIISSINDSIIVMCHQYIASLTHLCKVEVSSLNLGILLKVH